MKIVAIQGSPRKQGATQRILEQFLQGAAEAGHSHQTIHVYDLDINGCIACMACSDNTVEVCSQDDDFTRLFAQLSAADLLVFSTPVYFGQMSGPLKTFLDRFYTFCLDDFEIRVLQGKHYLTIITSGAPEGVFCKSLREYFDQWLGEFLHMKSAGSLLCGELTEDDAIIERQDILDQARRLGKNLSAALAS